MAYQSQKQKRQKRALKGVVSFKTKVNPLVEERQAAQESKQQTAKKASDERAAELRSYGIDAAGGVRTQAKTGPSRSLGPTIIPGTHEYDLQEGRDKALRVNQREKLRQQNQELQGLTLSGKKRRRGRGSLLSYMGSQSKGSLGPSGTLQ